MRSVSVAGSLYRELVLQDRDLGFVRILPLGDGELLAGEARRFPGVELRQDEVGGPLLGALLARPVKGIDRPPAIPFGAGDAALGKQGMAAQGVQRLRPMEVVAGAG